MVGKTERFEMRLDEEILKRVDKWRAGQDDLPSRAEAMRRLIEAGLSRSVRESVELTDGEKLLLIMMLGVYKKLGIKGEIDPQFIAEVIFGGHYWAPKWELHGIFHDQEDDPRDLKFVCDVMDMWRDLEHGYQELTTSDKQRVEREAHPFGKKVSFRGFDGNHESAKLSIARFLVEKMDRFPEFKSRDLNSHSPTVQSYERMLAVYQPMRDGLVGRGLAADEIIRILKARAYRAEEDGGA